MRRLVVGLLALVSLFSFIGWTIATGVNSHRFDVNCKQYIKRAADASSVDVAKRELGKAIEYCENNGLTEGIVSIFFKQPKNDIGFWYENLKIAYAELDALPEDSTPLEKTNVLMRVRESLTDGGENGIYVTRPDGIANYPNNVLYFWWATISTLALIVFLVWFLIGLYDYY